MKSFCRGCNSRALGTEAHAAPFLGAVGLFALSYLGIAISLYPMIVPPHFTLWQAASSDRTQAFLLVGTLLLLPVILMYTGWSYWVFRGKVRSECRTGSAIVVETGLVTGTVAYRPDPIDPRQTVAC